MAEGEIRSSQQRDQDPPAAVRKLELDTVYRMVEGEEKPQNKFELALPGGMSVEGTISLETLPLERGAVYAPYERMVSDLFALDDTNASAPFTPEMLDPQKRFQYLEWNGATQPNLVLYRTQTPAAEYPDAAYRIWITLMHPEVAKLEKEFRRQVSDMDLPRFQDEREAFVLAKRQEFLAAHAALWAPYEKVRDQLRVTLTLPPRAPVEKPLAVEARRDPIGHGISGISLTSFYPKDFGPLTTAMFAEPEMRRDTIKNEGTLFYKAQKRAGEICQQSGYALRVPKDVIPHTSVSFSLHEGENERRTSGVLTSTLHSLSAY